MRRLGHDRWKLENNGWNNLTQNWALKHGFLHACRQYWLTTVVVPITSTVRLPVSPAAVLLATNRTTGLIVPSVALLEQIRTVDRKRLIRRLGQVDMATLEQVDEVDQNQSGPDQVLMAAISRSLMPAVKLLLALRRNDSAARVRPVLPSPSAPG